MSQEFIVGLVKALFRNLYKRPVLRLANERLK